MIKKIVAAILITIIGLSLAIIVKPANTKLYHTTLLTVSENNNTRKGGTADMYLEIKPGSGRVYIDTFPLSKLDTQFSTRYAKEMACDFLEKDCSKYDFYYTIRADSSVVGGPSAGAATTILTIAALDKQPIKQDVAITGTINSGYLIGPVAGIIPKAEAARKSGLKGIIIPTLASLGMEELRYDNGSNVSINYSKEYDKKIIEYLSGPEFTVYEASDLYEALPHFINKRYAEPTEEYKSPEDYQKIMGNIADKLCKKREELKKEARTIILNNNSIANQTRISDEQISKSKNSYSKASYCFSSAIQLRKLTLQNKTEKELNEWIKKTREEIEKTNKDLEKKELKTINDIETYAIVKDRLIEAEEGLENINKNNISLQDLAYIIERADSAKIWSSFFGMKSTPYIINNHYLKTACQNKISEADERISYVELYLPAFDNGREELKLAMNDLKNGEYALCIFKASKAKAEASIISSALAVTKQRVDSLVTIKLRAAKRVLKKEISEGLFPIMGYSYYEYANSLKEAEPYSALTYAEYSLELSNLHIYFPKGKNGIIININEEVITAFIIGLITGLAALYIILNKN